MRRISVLFSFLLLLCLIGCAAPHASGDVLSETELITPPPSAAPTPTPSATPTPCASTPAETPVAYDRLGCVYALTATLYAAPDLQSEALQLLPQGQTLHLAPEQDGFYPVRCMDTQGYVPAADVADLGLQEDYTSGLVNVRLRDESILCYMLFAQEENFCGHPLYDADVCMLEPDTLTKLLAAQQRFMQDGYRIKLNDAYRPQRVQYLLFEEIPDRTYIASPERGSRHNRGIAVDMTLVDMQTGLELEMPSPMHTFGGAGRRDYGEHSAAARKNMDYMTGIMEEYGFTSIRSEWWHFMDLSAEEAHPLLDVPQSQFLIAP